MSSIRYEQSLFPVLEALRLVLGYFFKQVGQVDHTAIANYRLTRLVHDATGQQVKVVLDSVGDHSMAGIITAIKATYHVCFCGQQVNDLAFAFVAPLRAQYDCDFAHFSFSLSHSLSLSLSFSLSS